VIKMNFPLENPFYQLAYWLINTPGLGGLAALAVGGISVLAYGLTLRWIALGAREPSKEVYAYPTPALHNKATGRSSSP